MSRVDVLAVMAREARCLAGYQPRAAEELMLARSLVAELADAARYMADRAERELCDVVDVPEYGRLRDAIAAVQP